MRVHPITIVIEITAINTVGNKSLNLMKTVISYISTAIISIKKKTHGLNNNLPNQQSIDTIPNCDKNVNND